MQKESCLATPSQPDMAAEELPGSVGPVWPSSHIKAHQAKIRAIDKVPSAHAAKCAALQDAQGLADLLLDAEAKLGAMLAAMILAMERK